MSWEGSGLRRGDEAYATVYTGEDSAWGMITACGRVHEDGQGRQHCSKATEIATHIRTHANWWYLNILSDRIALVLEHSH